MDGTMDNSSGDEPDLEIIPNGRELVVAVNFRGGTVHLVRDRTEQILQMAKDILAAESPWMPAELLKFARDVVAYRRTTLLPIEMDLTPYDREIRNAADLRRAKKANRLWKEFSAFIRAVLAETFGWLDRQFRDWHEGRGSPSERVQ